MSDWIEDDRQPYPYSPEHEGRVKTLAKGAFTERRVRMEGGFVIWERKKFSIPIELYV